MQEWPSLEMIAVSLRVIPVRIPVQLLTVVCPSPVYIQGVTVKLANPDLVPIKRNNGCGKMSDSASAAKKSKYMNMNSMHAPVTVSKQKWKDGMLLVNLVNRDGIGDCRSSCHLCCFEL